jgi:outer membrane protein assembly factor BamE (lipoprotein component of BamABCDE complex)
MEAIQNQKEKLLALKESQIIELLGRPDRNELYKRNQKFFYYYLMPSPDCPNASTESKRLVIRFNAMGLAKEVAVE